MGVDDGVDVAPSIRHVIQSLSSRILQLKGTHLQLITGIEMDV